MGLFADLWKETETDEPFLGIEYPTDLGGHVKGPASSAKRSKGNSAPSPSVVTPKHSIFNESVIKNTDPQAAVQNVPDKELIESLCDHGSKFVAELSMVLARSRNGFDDPQTVSDLKTSEKVGELRYRLKVATEFAAAKSKELESKSKELESKSKEVEALAAELSESKLRIVNEVKAAREEGYQAGRADNVSSPISKQVLDTRD